MSPLSSPTQGALLRNISSAPGLAAGRKMPDLVRASLENRISLRAGDAAAEASVGGGRPGRSRRVHESSRNGCPWRPSFPVNERTATLSKEQCNGYRLLFEA